MLRDSTTIFADDEIETINPITTPEAVETEVEPELEFNMMVETLGEDDDLAILGLLKAGKERRRSTNRVI